MPVVRERSTEWRRSLSRIAITRSVDAELPVGTGLHVHQRRAARDAPATNGRIDEDCPFRRSA
jgi:hypothetical protein